MTLADTILVPTHIAVQNTRRIEQERLRKARYDTAHHRKTNHHKVRPFCFWDGEGPQDAGYALFGNSLGMEICHPFLSTEECLGFIIEKQERHPDYLDIAFGFNYDVSMILKDLPFRYLTTLHENNRTVWHGYEIEHIPHKWLRVKYGSIVAKIFDIRSFFAGNYVSALSEFGVGSPWQMEILKSGKASRKDFKWADIGEIHDYWKLEISLGPLLAEKLREAFQDAGYNLQSWHGPGALARMALKRHKIYDAMAESPEEVQIASRIAFAGGRFEMVQAGHAEHEIWNADIHSAYPAFATELPNLARGNWRKGVAFEPGKFGLYHIRYESAPDAFRVYPLFRRLKNGEVVWPCRVNGWYWSPEAQLVANDPDAVFLESWIFDEDDSTDKPFAWLEDYYDRRARLKRLGNPAQYTFKLIINSVYGQLAQRTGWDKKNRKPPRSHQLEWAGYITSACRAAIYRAGQSVPNSLVSLDTDGIYATTPIGNINIGEKLGQWELSRYDDGIFWQSGIYMLKRGTEWVKAKTRGIPKGQYTADDLMKALENNEPLRVSKRVFVTYGLAQSRPALLNQWIDEPHEFELGGKGKRFHFPRQCKHTCGKRWHRLGIPHFMFGISDEAYSEPHYLPWKENGPEVASRVYKTDQETLYDANHLDYDEAWVRDYAPA